MSATEKVNPQAPTPAGGSDTGSDLRSVANRIEGLLDDDGQFNPQPDQVSRGHPDYDPDSDPRNRTEETSQTDRDEKGRFRRKAQDEPETSNESPDLEAQEDERLGDDQPEDTEALQEDGDTDEDQTASAEDEATDEQDAETGRIETLSELAEALELPLEELKKSLTHSFRAAEQDVTVTLAELEAGYQKDADYRRRTGELAEARRAAEQDYQLKMQQFEQQHVFTAQTMNSAEQMLIHELNSDQLAQLRASDPAEWTARREEIGTRIASLRNQRQQASQQYETFQTQQRSELKTRETQALKERLPDFGPDHVQLARKTMSSMGFADQEISLVLDHRMVIGVLELAALRNEVETLRAQKAKAKDTVKRVKKEIPRFQKPGRKQVRQRGVSRDNVSRLKQRAKKSGSVQDAAKVIESMFS